MQIRLQKMIADNSDYSRRAAEKLIAEGKVTVNDKVVTEMGIKVDESDSIVVDNSVLYHHEKVYYLINKPIGYICSRKDNFNRPIITDLIHESAKIYPVGRLDYNTSGLLLVTNDGELTNGLTQPKSNIPKTYVAKLKGNYSLLDLRKLEQGIYIDGIKTKPAKVKPIAYNKNKKIGTVEITITEGRNLQVRKMFRAIGADTLKLKRVGYANFDLQKEQLGEGSYRELSLKEIRTLYSFVPKNNR